MFYVRHGVGQIVNMCQQQRLHNLLAPTATLTLQFWFAVEVSNVTT